MAIRPVVFRRGADSLAALVREQLKYDPFSGTIFIFRSKRADRLKILAWDGSGLVLFWKRLEHGAFRWPPISDGVMRLSASQRGNVGRKLIRALARPHWVLLVVIGFAARNRLRLRVVILASGKIGA